MSLTARIFIGYILFVGLCGYFVLHTIMEEVKPGVRQSTEETLVDTANLLAEFLREPLLSGNIQSPYIKNILTAYGQRHPQASIWGITKSGVNHRIYVTDVNGIVLIDSENKAEGQDYSQWNDVYLTLRGQYGARSTQEDPNDSSSSVMYVGAPIMQGNKIIGTVTVSKPARTLQPYIERAQKRLFFAGSGLVIIGIVAGLLFSIWLSRELRRLTSYAQNVSQGKKVALDTSVIRSQELRQLATALESMRTQLDGKAYIEEYIQTLTHELKSPLAGIHAAAELLQEPMSSEQRNKFVKNIDSETLRLKHLIERLLKLSKLEQQQQLENPKHVLINAIVSKFIETQSARVDLGNIILECDSNGELWTTGDNFLLEQCIANLLDNAFDFAPPKARLKVTIDVDKREVSVFNEGPNIPKFALSRLSERFYSLPRPRTGQKSTGLGLSFVQEAMKLHGAQLTIENITDGVKATLTFPAS